MVELKENRSLFALIHILMVCNSRSDINLKESFSVVPRSCLLLMNNVSLFNEE